MPASGNRPSPSTVRRASPAGSVGIVRGGPFPAADVFLVTYEVGTSTSVAADAPDAARPATDGGDGPSGNSGGGTRARDPGIMRSLPPPARPHSPSENEA
jgi:hypothetical protein